MQQANKDGNSWCEVKDKSEGTITRRNRAYRRDQCRGRPQEWMVISYLRVPEQDSVNCIFHLYGMKTKDVHL